MNLLFAHGLILLSAAMYQLPATPPMKMGLWETTSSMKMSMPGMNMPAGAGGRTTTVRACLTPERYAQDLATSQQQHDCTVTNQSFGAGTYSFDIACPRGNAKGHFEMKWEGDTGHGTMHMDMTAGDRAMSMDNTMTTKYLGADCGAVKPGTPQVVH